MHYLSSFNPEDEGSHNLSLTGIMRIATKRCLFWVWILLCCPHKRVLQIRLQHFSSGSRWKDHNSLRRSLTAFYLHRRQCHTLFRIGPEDLNDALVISSLHCVVVEFYDAVRKFECMVWKTLSDRHRLYLSIADFHHHCLKRFVVSTTKRG